MIKYYDSLAAYEADTKSSFESQVSLIGADNAIKIDGVNVVVDIQSAKTGSIVVLDGKHVMRFISVDTFATSSFFSNYTIVGVVRVGIDHPSFRGEIVILHKEFPTLPMVSIYQWRLTGYSLDGTDRTGTLSVRQADDSWAANHEYIIAYNATDEASLVEQLNTYFRTNEPFMSQEWMAIIAEDGGIDLQLQKWNDWRPSGYNKGMNGFALTSNLLPEWLATSNMLRMNGRRSGEGTITNMPRAIAYFTNDTANASYNPSSDVTTIKLSYPICLPAYLGTSAYQSDHCAYLRSIYGEGEDGWKKFLESFLPVRPTEYGINGDKKYGDAKSILRYLASKKYIDINGVEKPISPAADYIMGLGFDHELMRKGEWEMPPADSLFDLLDGIEYPINPDRNSDVINRALLAIGSQPLRNSSGVRSCSRGSAYSSWFASGGLGFASYTYPLYRACVVAPILRLKMPQSAYLK